MASVKDAPSLHLKRLKLRHFRTYDDLDLRLLPGVTLLHGPNAAGKTNILEAIFCLGATKSFRTRSDRELISWDPQEEPVPRFARIEGDAEARNGPVRVEMAIAEQPARGPVEVSVRKQFKLNGRPVRAGDVVGEMKVVLFSPDDVDLVTGSPSLRRRFMDLMLCQIDHRYLRLLQEYGRVVVQRNSLLQRLRGRPDPATLLEFWDEKLVAAGVQIMTTRKTMLRVLNEFAREAYTDLSGLGEELTIAYLPSLEGASDAPDAHLTDMFRSRIGQLQTKEIYQGATLVGPHRDDLQFLVNGKDMQSYGSRGQQRSVALSLRLAELRYMTNRTGEQPILLLDEAMAELDEDRRRLLLRLMQTHPQVLVTTSNIGAFPDEFRDAATLLRVDAGSVDRRPPIHARAS
jgi:DNA replication and repair protein RecF